MYSCDALFFFRYGGPSGRTSTSREAAVAALRDFRAKATIFEALGNTYTDAAVIMTNKRKLHGSIIKTTVQSNKIKSKSRMDALSSGHDDADAEVQESDESDGGIDGVTISDMFGDETSGKSSSSKSHRGVSGGLKKKTRKHREDASEFIIPSRPSAAAAAAGQFCNFTSDDTAFNSSLHTFCAISQRAFIIITRTFNDTIPQTKRFPFATTSTCGWKTW